MDQEAATSNTTCVCQQYDLIWGAKVSCEFRKKVVEISKRQNFDPNDFMAVMAVETSETFSPSKIKLKNYTDAKGKTRQAYLPLTKEEIMKLPKKFDGAVGLIQFTHVAIQDLNTLYGFTLTKRKLALMTQLEQLDYAEKHIAMWKKIKKITGKLTLGDLYIVVFAPDRINGSDDNTILYKKGTKEYEANESLDKDNNGITKKELATRAYEKYKIGETHKEDKFSCGIINDKKEETNNILFFPLVIKPLNTNAKDSKFSDQDYEGAANHSMGAFQYPRNKGNRLHAARDLYTPPLEEIYAMTSGIVTDISQYYCSTWQITIQHDYEYIKGYKLVVRYGEVDSKSIKVKVGDKVQPHQVIAHTGKLIKQGKPLLIIEHTVIYMLHLEMYTGKLGPKPELNTQHKKGHNKFMRREDLFDPLPLLQQAFKNSQQKGYIK